jgi:hypothetical protein
VCHIAVLGQHIAVNRRVNIVETIGTETFGLVYGTFVTRRGIVGLRNVYTINNERVTEAEWDRRIAEARKSQE